MTDEQHIARAVALAEESVREGWGGPFGAVIVQAGEVIATGQNLVLRTGDPTAHAEVVAIRAAAQLLLPSTLQADTGGRARMLAGCTLYASCFPCPMCLGASVWARVDAVVYACDAVDAAAAGFDDQFIYADLARPLADRSLPMRQVGRAQALHAMRAWQDRAGRLLY